jgi:hypothetical protein
VCNLCKFYIYKQVIYEEKELNLFEFLIMLKNELEIIVRIYAKEKWITVYNEVYYML